jgi:CxxC motif-containing protein (DUF1111 family)
MREQLADPMPAPTDLNASAASAGYYGFSFEKETPLTLERRREWKTPPLWGLRDSGPYLHDGRADSLDAAIACHGGEAADSAARFRALTPDAQARLVAYLSTLGVPGH